MNEDIMRTLGFEEQLNSIHLGKCPFCKQDIGEFRDELSRKENKISGLCQGCQDNMFGGLN